MKIPGDRIKQLREAQGLSFRTLAARCNGAVNYTTIRRIERNGGYQKETLEAIAQGLGVDLLDLFYPPELKHLLLLPEPVREHILGIVRRSLELSKVNAERTP